MPSRVRLRLIDRFAALAHDGQVDKQGAPYINHSRAVAANVSDAAKPVALCHDVLEDTSYTARDLRSLLSDVEIDAVLLLTREPGTTYAEYVAQIAVADGEAGRLAREVKVADLRHNLSRLTSDLAGLEKRYLRALAQLGAT